jgi:hypothetical protein
MRQATIIQVCLAAKLHPLKCKAVPYLGMSQNDASEQLRQTTTQWAEVIGQLFDRLTGKGASVTYTFDNLVIDMPRAEGPGGQELASAKWTINGKVVITAEAHKAEETGPRASVSSAA